MMSVPTNQNTLTMRSLLLCCLFFHAFNLAAQQSNVNGIVSIHNSETETGKRLYVVNAQVEDDFGKAQPAITDVNGQFKLIYVGAHEGLTVSFTVKKTGLEVVNMNDLHAIAGQTDWVKISMAPPEKIAEYRRQIYQVGKTEAEKRLERKVEETTNQLTALRKQHLRNDARIDQLMQQLQELDERHKKIEAQATELANKYSPLNLDDVSPLFRQAFKLFQKGDLDSSLSLLASVNLPKMVDDILTERGKVANLLTEVHHRDSTEKQRTKDATATIKFKADLHTTRFEFDSARNLYKLLIKLDTLNYHSYFDYALFLDELNDKSAALNLYLRALELIQRANDSTTGDKRRFLAETYNNLGLVYKTLLDFDKAGAALEKSLDLYAALAREEPQLYEEKVSTTYNNLAIYYSSILKFGLAENAHLKALEIFQKVKTNNPMQYEFDLAKLLINLGHFYWETKDFNKAQVAYNRAVALLQPLGKKETREYQAVWATLQINIGNNSAQKHQFVEAKNALLQAYAIYEKLSASNPYTYMTDFSSVCSAIGLLFAKANDFINAETYFRKAYTIDTELVRSNPLVYSAGLTYTVNNLAALYIEKNDIVRATATFNDILAIYKDLNVENSEIFKPRIADLYGGYGLLYHKAHDYKRAEASYLKSLELYNEVFNNNPVYKTEISNRQNNLGGLYFDMGDFDKAKMIYKGCLDWRKRLAEQDPFAWLPEVANSLNSLGNVYSNTNELDSAAFYYNSALEIYRKLAKDHPEVYAVDLATTLNNLGNFYRLTKDYSRATAAFDEAIQIYKELYKNQPAIYDDDLAKTLSNAGFVYQDLTEYTKAESFFKEALDLFKQIAVRNNRLYDEDVGNSYNHLGLLYFVLNDLEKAEPVFQQAIAIRKHLAKESPELYEVDLAQSLMYFGYLYNSNKNYVQADYWMKESSDIWDKHAREHIDEWKLNKRALLELYYTVLDTITVLKERIVWQQKAYEVSLKYYEGMRNAEESQREFIYASSQLTWYYTLNGEFAKAEQVAKSALVGGKTGWLIARLAHTLLLQGKYDDAAKLYLEIKTQKNESGDQFGAVCIKELDLLENVGITNKDFNRVRSLLKN